MLDQKTSMKFVQENIVTFGFLSFFLLIA